MAALRDKIEHVIVLMFENRSFDHLMGFLDHPKKFKGLTGKESNPHMSGDSNPLKVSSDAIPQIHTDPGHHHEDVMDQLFFGINDRYNNLKSANNKGFLSNYKSIVDQKHKKKRIIPGASEIMKCFPHPHPQKKYLNVMGTLAKEFALCDKWFCSVPGATWPNRQFAHAATSHGKVDNKIKLYGDRTIYQLMADHDLTWDIYHDGPCQSMAFYKLWFKKNGGFKPFARFHKDVIQNKLANYVFLESRHFKLFNGYTNDMHPSNNEQTDKDFIGAEKLLYDVYLTLINKKEIWDKTLLVVTFDEHGGFYDHVKPPMGKKYIPDNFKHKKFQFNILGPRVPTLLISPRILKGVIESKIYDHSSIIATTRKIFGIKESLTNRDKTANTFDHLIMDKVRKVKEVPLPVFSSDGARLEPRGRGITHRPGKSKLNGYQEELEEMVQQIKAVKAGTIKDVEANISKKLKKTQVKKRSLTLTVAPKKKTANAVNKSMVNFTNEFFMDYGIKE